MVLFRPQCWRRPPAGIPKMCSDYALTGSVRKTGPDAGAGQSMQQDTGTLHIEHRGYLINFISAVS
jgi:hypothetical protein